ncbi:MAG: DUF2284 domain-containing protein [Candidatus Thorarchaeota archaeon]
MIPDKRIEEILLANGFTDYKWIDHDEIPVSHWVRMKCMYGCSEYGKNACCPPNVPSVQDCQELLGEFKRILIFQFSLDPTSPSERTKWAKRVNKRLLELERTLFLEGLVRAFVLIISSCNLCSECTGNKKDCKHPSEARPTPEAFAIDVYSAAQNVGFPIHVLKTRDETMNRYALVLVD